MIAECASNHGGDLSLAKAFIRCFAEAGADYIKFQTTRVKHLRKDDPQVEWFTRAELSDEAHVELKAECEAAGVQFLTTVYHPDEVPMIKALGCDTVKVGSGEAHEPELAKAIRKAKFDRVFVATGITSMQQSAYEYPYVLGVEYLACVTRYPCPAACAVRHYGHEQYLPTGWSDHCLGLDGCETAIIHGATVIEKHVQLPQQARLVKPWEASVSEFRKLRAMADEDPARFKGRWQAA